MRICISNKNKERKPVVALYIGNDCTQQVKSMTMSTALVLLSQSELITSTLFLYNHSQYSTSYEKDHCKLSLNTHWSLGLPTKSTSDQSPSVRSTVPDTAWTFKR